MLKLFRSNSAFSIVLMLILLALIWFRAFYEGVILVESKCYMPFFGSLHTLEHQFPLAGTIIAFIMVAFGGGLLNFLVNSHELTSKRTFLPLLCYSFFMSGSRELQQLYPQIFSNLLLIIALNLILHTYRKNKEYQQTFLSGLCIGIAALFYLPAALILPVFFIALIILRPFIWREYAITIMGFLLPFIYVWSYYYWFDLLPIFREQLVCYTNVGTENLLALFAEKNPALWFMLGMLFVGVSKYMSSGSAQKIKTRKAYGVLLWIIPTAIAALFISKDISFESLSVLCIPASILTTLVFYQTKKKWIAESLFWLFFGIQLVSIWMDKLETLYL